MRNGCDEVRPKFRHREFPAERPARAWRPRWQEQQDNRDEPRRQQPTTLRESLSAALKASARIASVHGSPVSDGVFRTVAESIAGPATTAPESFIRTNAAPETVCLKPGLDDTRQDGQRCDRARCRQAAR